MESDVLMLATPSPGGIEKRKQYGKYTELVLLGNVFCGGINTFRHEIQLRLSH